MNDDGINATIDNTTGYVAGINTTFIDKYINDTINITLPLPEDYAESSDAPITPEIQALAANLSHDPARIYWWVYKNIRYEPYYGAMHGAEQTLMAGGVNGPRPVSILR